jgi:DNA-binding NtrC family response regulator
MATILIVDDEPGIRAFMADALTDAGYRVVEAENGVAAMGELEGGTFDLMLLDLKMPGSHDGMDVLRHARAAWPRMPVIVLTAHGNVTTAVEAMRLGAADFLEKPLDGPGELRRLAARTINGYVAGSSQHLADVAGPTAEGAAETDLTAAGSGADTARFKRLLRELRRRHVYKVAATYLAVGFVALQSAQLLLPGLPLPGWTYRALVTLIILGFPIALVLGWVFDVQVTRTPAMTEGSE